MEIFQIWVPVALWGGDRTLSPPTGRQGPICKKTNYIQIFGREGGGGRPMGGRQGGRSPPPPGDGSLCLPAMFLQKAQARNLIRCTITDRRNTRNRTHAYPTVCTSKMTADIHEVVTSLFSYKRNTSPFYLHIILCLS